MRSLKVKTGGAVLASLGLFALAACGASDGSTADGGSDSVSGGGSDIPIGLVLPLSGSIAALGEDQSAGFNYVIDQINDAGGVKSMGGAKIAVHEVDDTSEPRIAADESRRLVQQENVVAIAGYLTTNQVLAAAPLLDQLKVPGLSVTGTTTGPGSYMFSNGFTVDGIASSSVNFLEFLNESQNGSLKRVALAYQDYEAAQAAAEVEKELLDLNGYDVVGEVSLSGTASDLGPAILKLRALQPDAVLSYALNEVGIRLHQARAAHKYNDPVWIGAAGGWTEKDVWNALGEKTAQQTLGERSFAVGYYDASLGLESTDDLVASAKDAGVESDFGGHFVMGAQTARTLQAALELAGETGEITPESVRNGLENLELTFDGGNVYLPRDELSFGEDRLYEDQTGVVLQWTKDGSQEPLWPEQFARVEPRV